jgi:adenylosuccinate lyase
MSEAVMLALAKKGMGRQKAHELVRELAVKSHSEQRLFNRVLSENDAVQKLLNKKEIEQALEPRNYLGTALEQIERVVKKTKNERKDRGLPD